VKRTQHVRVLKRDGSVEAFEPSKLRRCLAAAMSDCQHDARLAEALVQAVLIHLRELDPGRPASTEYVFRCCQTILAETGLGEVAEALAQHRRQRAARRERLSVTGPAPTGRRAARWRKEALVQTLLRRCGLRRPVARIVAAEVERRVFALGYHVVSTGLIRELLRSELLAWGLCEPAWRPGVVESVSGVATAPEAKEDPIDPKR